MIMKKYALLVALLCMVTTIFAQVTEKGLPMSQGTSNALVIDIPMSNKKDVEKAWEKYMKSFKGKTKKDKKQDEIFTDNAKMENISNNTVDVYTKVIENGEDTQLRAWFDLGGAFLSEETHVDRYPAAVLILDQFALSIKQTNIEEELKMENKNLDKRQKEFKNLEKDKEKLENNIVKYEKEIEELKEKIVQAKADIEQNIKDQEVKTNEVNMQKEVVEKVEKKLKNLD